MFRITDDQSSGSLVKCMAKNYKNDSIVSFDRLLDDGSFVIRNIWSTFKYFIILIVSTYYIFCITWIIKSLIGCEVSFIN